MTNSTVQNVVEKNCEEHQPQMFLPFKQDVEKAKAQELKTFKIFTDALQFYKSHEILVAFNGGKDCTVVLHMLGKFFKQTCLEHIRIPVLYIKPEHSFDEIENVVEKCKKLYNIEMIIRAGDIKKALEDVTASMTYVKAVFMGSRYLDPYCGKLSVMQPTDPGWPPLMRINPILNWTCWDIWNYIFVNKVPYCSLYDQGYTSLGNKLNTFPNPYLKRVHPVTGVVSYGPAHAIAHNDKLERAGRR